LAHLAQFKLALTFCLGNWGRACVPGAPLGYATVVGSLTFSQAVRCLAAARPLARLACPRLVPARQLSDDMMTPAMTDGVRVLAIDTTCLISRCSELWPAPAFLSLCSARFPRSGVVTGREQSPTLNFSPSWKILQNFSCC